MECQTLGAESAIPHTTAVNMFLLISDHLQGDPGGQDVVPWAFDTSGLGRMDLLQCVYRIDRKLGWACGESASWQVSEAILRTMYQVEQYLRTVDGERALRHTNEGSCSRGK